MLYNVNLFNFLIMLFYIIYLFIHISIYFFYSLNSFLVISTMYSPLNEYGYWTLNKIIIIIIIITSALRQMVIVDEAYKTV